jgi:hypothetical protein
MTKLEFVTEPSYQCPEAGDLAFVKATRTIGGRDAIEEYTACELLPLSASFYLGVILEGETPVSKLMVPLPNFPVARRPDETNDGFWVRVEIAVVNIVGRGEHRVCIEKLPNGGQVNRVFEQAGVPYEPRLEPGSEACEQAAKKRKNDVVTGPSVKCAKTSEQKVMPAKASVASKGTGVASSKTVPTKAPPGTQVSKGTSIPPKASASKAAMTVVATVTTSRAGMLRFSTSVKRPAVALPLGAKGKQVKVSVRPSPASATPCDAPVQQPVAAKVGTGWVSYCAILDSVPSAESHSSLSNGFTGSESVMASPLLALDVHIPSELSCMTEVPEAEMVIAMEVCTASPEGWLSLFL